MSKRKQHAPEFKAKVALEALKGEETAAELASRFGVQSTLALFDAPFAITFLVLVWFLGGPTVFGPLVVLLVFGALALFSAARQARAGLKLFEASADQASLIMTRREQLDQIIERGHLGEFASEVRRYEKRRASAQEVAESNLAAALNLSQTGGLATTVSVLGVGSLVVLAGDMTTGGLAACLILGQRGVGGLLGLVNALARRQVSASALKTIQSLLSLPSASPLAAPVQTIDTSVGLQLQVGQQTFEVRPGHCMVIHSPYADERDRVFQVLTQALEQGKETLSDHVSAVKLFADNGVSVSPRECHVTACDASPKVFNGTVLENMTAFDAEATDRAMFYSEQIGLSEAIGRLRDGVETPLSPGLGIPFSDGHLKRLMLVRALSGKPQLLLLNRPSQYLDAAGTSQLADLLQSLDGKTTVIAFESAEAFTSQFQQVFELPDLPATSTEVAA